jgi:hypothetical protein
MILPRNALLIANSLSTVGRGWDCSYSVIRFLSAWFPLVSSVDIDVHVARRSIYAVDGDEVLWAGADDEEHVAQRLQNYLVVRTGLRGRERKCAVAGYEY